MSIARKTALILVGLAIGLPAEAALGQQAKKARKPKAGPGQYKRVHQRIMKQLLAGRYDEAAAAAKKVLQKQPGDVESLYCLAIAQARTGDAKAANATVKRAVEAGLSLGRFLAGPRDLLRPLVESPGFGALLKERPIELLHGPMVGCVTDRSARFWVRTASEATVQVAVSPSAKLEDPLRSAAVRTRKTRDTTAVAEVTGLKADTRYHYDVLIGGKSTMPKQPWSFRTVVPAGRKAKFQVGFGGGAGYVPPNERVWDTICKHRPTAFLFLGDNVYIDAPQSPDMQRYCYYRRQSRPEYHRLIASTAIYAIWDDHDFGLNDCSGGPQINEPEWKIPVWRVFCNNWNNPSYGGGEKQPGCWFDFAVGEVHFFMTDGRYYRTEPRKTPKEERSMLGPVQKRWLLDRLKASKATFKVIASGTPWTFFAKGKSQDTWNGFQKERGEIFSFLADNRIDGVVLLSADRHRHDVWKIPRDKGYDLYEFETSRLTNQHVHPTMKQAEFSWNKSQGFGLLTFDTTLADPTVTYQIVSIDDEVIHTFTVKKSQLTSK